MERHVAVMGFFPHAGYEPTPYEFLTHPYFYLTHPTSI